MPSSAASILPSTPFLLLFLFLLQSPSSLASGGIGWSDIIASEESEWEDVRLQWLDNTIVPDWLKGHFVRNGPGRLNFGGQRSYSMYMDGAAKLHGFRIDGEKVSSTAKFLKTASYIRNEAAGDIRPSITLAPIIPNDWSPMEVIEALQNGFDNHNTNVWRYGGVEGSLEGAQFVANTDYPAVTEFEINTLNTKGQLPDPPHSWASCAHPVREPGTENTINYQLTMNMFMMKSFQVFRYDRWDNPQLIVNFRPPKTSYIHSFSVTDKYAIFFFYPLVNDFMAVMAGRGHAFAALKWLEGEMTDVIVVDIKSGEIKLKSKTRAFFSAHHVNAYQDGTNLVVDLCEGNRDGLATYMDIESMRKASNSSSPNGTSRLRRFTIDLASGQVADVEVKTTAEMPKFIVSLDFPTINEQYRGKAYCFVYGVVALHYDETHLVKKSMCKSTDDLVYSAPNTYFSEATFVPRPGATREDDGVLVTVAHDGVAKKSFLLVLDAASMTVINRALVPAIIPYSFHGNFFAGL